MLKDLKRTGIINTVMKVAWRGKSVVYVYIIQAARDEDGRSGRNDGFWKAALHGFVLLDCMYHTALRSTK